MWDCVVWLIFPQTPDEWIIQFERSHSVLDGMTNVRNRTCQVCLEFVPREGAINKQRNYRKQCPDFFPDSRDLLLFLPQNDVRIFHEYLFEVSAAYTRELRSAMCGNRGFLGKNYR
jgi:hypothetical protein